MRLNRTPEQIFVFNHLIRWTALVIPISLSVGSLIALFLWLLDKSIHFRWDHPLAPLPATPRRHRHLLPL
ncbi:hypothetical protein ACQ86N_24445 [Puia sp. P3]|uniref:hypothetical protein n=1 Tax=Puia sp. P3 TaxID=3423952 RepID=UPI003D67A5BF